jgi:MFS family permease
VMSFGWAAMSGAAINIIVAPWFDRRRGLAISLALNGASAGGIVFAPLLVFLIGRLDFAAAVACVGALMLAIVLPTAAFVLRPKRPDERDTADDAYDPTRPQTSVLASAAKVPPWRLSAVLRSPDFHSISISFALGLMAQVRYPARLARHPFGAAHIPISRPSRGIATSPSRDRRRFAAPHSTAWLLLTTGLPSAASSSSIASIWVVLVQLRK